MTEVTWDVPGPPTLAREDVERAVEAALAHGGRAGAELSVVFCSDPALAELHGRHLGDDSPTDVMSFDLGDDGPGPVGELYVSVDRARAVAGKRGVDPARELCLYVVHGVLHLCGLEDGTDAERARMRVAEAAVMETLGYAPDLAPHEFGCD